MAPEQVRGERDRVGPASDVWALGVLLYEALVGRPPFQGRSAVELLARVCEGRVPPPRAVDASVPAALEAVCLRALAPRPEDRFADGAALAAALDGALAAPAPRRGAAGLLGAVVLGALGAAALLLARGYAGDARPAPGKPAPPPASAAPPTPPAPPEPPRPPPARAPEPAPLGPTPEEAPPAPQGVHWACRWLVRRLEPASPLVPWAEGVLSHPEPGPDGLRSAERGVVSNTLEARAKDLDQRGAAGKAQARGWHRLCAELGCSNCRTLVGVWLREDGDLEGAVRWLRLGLAAGDVKARTRLASSLLAMPEPDGQREGRALALEAAASPDATSLAYEIAGQALAGGVGGPREPERAAQLLRRAATGFDKPDRRSARLLLQLLEAGEAPPLDAEEPARLRALLEPAGR
jgi:hypothetical protein